MSAPIDGGPAFPVSTGHHPDTMMKDPRIGMTLRDYFAAAALQGLLASDYTKQVINEMELNKASAAALIAEYSYIAADAMLAERGRQ